MAGLKHVTEIGIIFAVALSQINNKSSALALFRVEDTLTLISHVGTQRRTQAKIGKAGKASFSPTTKVDAAAKASKASANAGNGVLQAKAGKGNGADGAKAGKGTDGTKGKGGIEIVVPKAAVTDLISNFKASAKASKVSAKASKAIKASKATPVFPSLGPSVSPENRPTENPSIYPSVHPSSSPSEICKREFVESTSALCPTGFNCLQNADFGAGDQGRFNVDLSLELSLEITLSSTEYIAAYVEARCKWMEVVVGDLSSRPSSILTSGARGDCANTLPSSIDDLHICGRDEPIDGEGKTLGSARPLFTRVDPTTGKHTTVTGQMQFDTADLAKMVSDGSIKGVIAHEMGHVLGIGSLWGRNGTGVNNLLDQNNDYRAETRATNVWQNDWGCVGTPPIEKSADRPGSDFVHWAENCLVDELMSTFKSGSMPFSKLTIASLEDMGYTVNYDAADSFDGRNTTCCTGSPTSIMSTPTLSDDGRKNAIEFGEKILSENKLSDELSILLDDDDTGLVYVGDKVVVVLYIEGGIIFEVFVTKDDNKEIPPRPLLRF